MQATDLVLDAIERFPWRSDGEDDSNRRCRRSSDQTTGMA
jgi:hypothetical protein